ncbi:hypothetical protein [Cytobacillus solani]|nr:hypothetical protein [Cytobacillus solani]
MECVMCNKKIDPMGEQYEPGESLGEYWCMNCAERESDTGEVY